MIKFLKEKIELAVIMLAVGILLMILFPISYFTPFTKKAHEHSNRNKKTN